MVNGVHDGKTNEVVTSAKTSKVDRPTTLESDKETAEFLKKEIERIKAEHVAEIAKYQDTIKEMKHQIEQAKEMTTSEDTAGSETSSDLSRSSSGVQFVTSSTTPTSSPSSTRPPCSTTSTTTWVSESSSSTSPSSWWRAASPATSNGSWRTALGRGSQAEESCHQTRCGNETTVLDKNINIRLVSVKVHKIMSCLRTKHVTCPMLCAPRHALFSISRENAPFLRTISESCIRQATEKLCRSRAAVFFGLTYDNINMNE